MLLTRDAQKLSHIFGNVMYGLGVVVIALALISFATNMQLEDIVNWMRANFGATFSLSFSALLLFASFSIIKIWKKHQIEFWAQVGAQVANAISTLALTFTLLGISLGIGTLSSTALSPENVNEIISSLTSQFSIAFMTTVVGLPAATIVRAIVAILVAKHVNSARQTANAKLIEEA